MNELTARARILDSTVQPQDTDSTASSEASSFRSLVEASLQGIIVHRDWRILFANRAAAFILGYDTVAELMSVANLLRLYPEDEHARMERYRDARLRGEPTPERYHIRLLHKSGSTIWVELLASMLDWQGEPALQSAFVDISESVRAQQLLRESEERQICCGIWACRHGMKCSVGPIGSIVYIPTIGNKCAPVSSPTCVAYRNTSKESTACGSRMTPIAGFTSTLSHCGTPMAVHTD